MGAIRSPRKVPVDRDGMSLYADCRVTSAPNCLINTDPFDCRCWLRSRYTRMSFLLCVFNHCESGGGLKETCLAERNRYARTRASRALARTHTTHAFTHTHHSRIHMARAHTHTYACITHTCTHFSSFAGYNCLGLFNPCTQSPSESEEGCRERAERKRERGYFYSHYY